MTKLCRLCQKHFEEVLLVKINDITHGICDECVEEILAKLREVGEGLEDL